ncbi:hypothetical protein [Botryobacter ruber]|uniref:hypothetical protein n=1 Tax=Botryobacter ruber TaxID=2171629 RepID=UPI001F0BA847|nr:hypothetical protein [Botryobacter ruber]
MKKILVSTVSLCLLAFASNGQAFTSNLDEARKSYTSGNLSDSRAAMAQMLHDIDIEIGRELLKLLPPKMEALAANTKDDNVTSGASSFGMGLLVHRTYGTDTLNSASIDIINNSPLINSLQALLSLPFVANSDPNQKVVKVQGHKAILNKMEGAAAGKTDYELQIPLQNTLISFKLNDAKEESVLKLASTIPLDKIAQMAK